MNLPLGARASFSGLIGGISGEASGYPYSNTTEARISFKDKIMQRVNVGCEPVGYHIKSQLCLFTHFRLSIYPSPYSVNLVPVHFLIKFSGSPGLLNFERLWVVNTRETYLHVFCSLFFNYHKTLKTCGCPCDTQIRNVHYVQTYMVAYWSTTALQLETCASNHHSNLNRAWVLLNEQRFIPWLCKKESVNLQHF